MYNQISFSNHGNMMEICFPHNPTEEDQIFEPNTQFMAEKNQNIPGFSK